MLSDDEIYQQLCMHGVQVGPVGVTTRKLYMSRLEHILAGKEKGVDIGNKNCYFPRQKSPLKSLPAKFRIQGVDPDGDQLGQPG